jgi:NAD-dependent deacetylase
MLCVGSTLGVYPVAGCVPEAKRRGARVVILNSHPTEMDDIADDVVRGRIAEHLPPMLGVAEWLD